MHDALCRSADEIFENQRDLVHTKVRYESDEEGDNASENSTALPGAKSKNKSSNKQKTQTDDILQVDDFTLGAPSDGGSNSNCVRYMDDWSGVLTDVDGGNLAVEEAYGDDDTEELDDQYFEMRRQDTAEDSDDEGDDTFSENESAISESNTESEDENDMEVVEAPRKFDDQSLERDEDDDDAFMEVGIEVQAGLQEASKNQPSGMVIDSFGQDDGSAEADMEGVVLALKKGFL